jgi:hypothetical protein
MKMVAVRSLYAQNARLHFANHNTEHTQQQQQQQQQATQATETHNRPASINTEKLSEMLESHREQKRAELEAKHAQQFKQEDETIKEIQAKIDSMKGTYATKGYASPPLLLFFHPLPSYPNQASANKYYTTAPFSFYFIFYFSFSVPILPQSSRLTHDLTISADHSYTAGILTFLLLFFFHHRPSYLDQASAYNIDTLISPFLSL